MELNVFSWNAFLETGDIEAYLLYKTMKQLTEEQDCKWETLRQEVLL